MPHMGISVTEGTVIAWHKAVGDAVRADEPVCDIATDKVDTEILAPADGVIARVIAAEGETVSVGDPLAEMTVAALPAAATDCDHQGSASILPSLLFVLAAISWRAPAIIWWRSIGIRSRSPRATAL